MQNDRRELRLKAECYGEIASGRCSQFISLRKYLAAQPPTLQVNSGPRQRDTVPSHVYKFVSVTLIRYPAAVARAR
jgi:hypothetical protein